MVAPNVTSRGAVGSLNGKVHACEIVLVAVISVRIPSVRPGRACEFAWCDDVFIRVTCLPQRDILVDGPTRTFLRRLPMSTACDVIHRSKPHALVRRAERHAGVRRIQPRDSCEDSPTHPRSSSQQLRGEWGPPAFTFHHLANCRDTEIFCLTTLLSLLRSTGWPRK